MTLYPASLICDIFSDLSREEIDQNQLVCAYWDRIIEQNAIILLRYYIAELKVDVKNFLKEPTVSSIVSYFF